MPRREAHHRSGSHSVHSAFTDASDGDLNVDGPEADLAARRSRIAPHPWTWLRQVHGAEVVHVHKPGDFCDELADAAVTMTPGAVLAVHSADCAGVVLSAVDRSGNGIVGAAHTGWRGLESGVVQEAVQWMRDLGGDSFVWDLGPCISPGGLRVRPRAPRRPPVPVRRLGRRAGRSTESPRSTSGPACGPRSPRRAVSDDPVSGPPPCTALDAGFYSWRARGDNGPPGGGGLARAARRAYPWHP